MTKINQTSPENWKPATKTDQVIQSLVALVNDPEPEHPLRGDLAEGKFCSQILSIRQFLIDICFLIEFLKDKKKFIKNAEEFTKKHAEKRPSD